MKNGLYILGNRSCLLFFFILQLIHYSLLETSVRVVEGDNAILQCKGQKSKSDVYWRYEESKVVINIVGRQEKKDEQNVMFKDRVIFFPLQFDEGNYSIQLINVKISDSGQYSCKIIPNAPQKITLTVNEREETRLETAGQKGGTGKPDYMWSLLLGCVLLCSFRF